MKFNKLKEIFVLGGGGHAKVVIDTLLLNDFVIKGIFDDDSFAVKKELKKYPYMGEINKFGHSNYNTGIIGIGNNHVRHRYANAMTMVKWEKTVHPFTYVHPTVKIGDGSVIFAGAVIQPDVVIGRHCIINTGANIDHDCILEDFVHIAPGVNLAGGVFIKEGSFIGISCSVLPNKTIGSWSVVGAGTVVIKDLPGNVTAVGVPAKIIK